MTKEQLCGTRIEKLEVSNRCYNALTRSGYRIVGDLVGKTPEQLQRIRNIGEKTFNELIEKIESIGFALNEEGTYVIDTDKLIQENLKDLTDETYMEKLTGILSELASNTKEIENIDKQILDLQQQKVEKEKENTTLVNMVCSIYKTLEKNTKKEKDILEKNKTKKYIIR